MADGGFNVLNVISAPFNWLESGLDFIAEKTPGTFGDKALRGVGGFVGGLDDRIINGVSNFFRGSPKPEVSKPPIQKEDYSPPVAGPSVGVDAYSNMFKEGILGFDDATANLTPEQKQAAFPLYMQGLESFFTKNIDDAVKKDADPKDDFSITNPGTWTDQMWVSTILLGLMTYQGIQAEKERKDERKEDQELLLQRDKESRQHDLLMQERNQQFVASEKALDRELQESGPGVSRKSKNVFG